MPYPLSHGVGKQWPAASVLAQTLTPTIDNTLGNSSTIASSVIGFTSPANALDTRLAAVDA